MHAQGNMGKWGARSDSDSSTSSSSSRSSSSVSSAGQHPLGSQFEKVKKQRVVKGSATADRRRPATTVATNQSFADRNKSVRSFLDPHDDDDGFVLRKEHTLEPSALTSRTASPQTIAPRAPRESSPSWTASARQHTDSPPPSGQPPQSDTEAAAGAVTRQVVKMEYGDEYVGEALAVKPTPSLQDLRKSTGGTTAIVTAEALLFVPHGSGTLQSSSGKHCYVGDFVHRERHGQGKLLTERFVLWCKWAGNRPDFAVSARLDLTSGDKYLGYLAARTDADVVARLNKQQPQTRSKFSVWVNSTVFSKERWGELCASNGSRYFGQWESDKRHGFGCLLLPSGDRYVGLFASDHYHGSGVLFARTTGASLGGASRGTTEEETAPRSPAHPSCSTRDATLLHLRAAGWRDTHQSLSRNAIVEDLLLPSLAAVGHHSITYDGVWHEGQFQNEQGTVTFPCGTAIVGDWDSQTHTSSGRVACPRRPRLFEPSSRVVNGATLHRRWIVTYQWEPLLCGSSDGAKQKSLYTAKPLRSRILKSSDKHVIVAQLKRFLKEDTVAANGIKVFRRCFYFLYGTCGASQEIGGGLAGNPLGWCQFRAAFGGCIHRGRGRPITEADIDAALGDVFSMIGSLHRWTAEILGDAVMERVQEVDAETAIPRIVLDSVLQEVFPVLLNLYAQVHQQEEEAVQLALSRLRHITLDDLGVRFGRNESDRLFDPYADAARCLDDLSRCKTLSEMIHALVTWSKEIDTSTKLAQVSLHEEQLTKLSNVMRERRHSTVVSHTHCSGARGGARTGGGEPETTLDDARVAALANTSFSAASDAATSTTADTSLLMSDTQMGPADSAFQYNRSFASPSASPMVEFHSPTVLPHTPSPTSSSRPLDLRQRFSSKFLLDAASASVEAGSADDLIPIHQYVLIRGGTRVPQLCAITKLLVDLCADENVIDGTSQDSFCITTLHACVTTLTQLDSNIRDVAEQSILTPLSVFLKRLDETAAACQVTCDPQLVADLGVWLPEAVERFAVASVAPESGDVSTTAVALGALLPTTAPLYLNITALQEEGAFSAMMATAARLLATFGVMLEACDRDLSDSEASRTMLQHYLLSTKYQQPVEPRLLVAMAQKLREVLTVV